MTDDLDIFRAAKLVIEHHGERADLCADRRRKALLLRGYVDASALWGEVVAAIEEMQRAARGEPLK